MAAIGRPVREIVAEPLEWPLPRRVDIPQDAPTVWTPDPDFSPEFEKKREKVPEKVDV
jgi:hypothetical protein